MNTINQFSIISNIFCFLLISFSGYAQFPDINLGKITAEYASYSTCDFAPNSPAIILKNDGYSSIELQRNSVTSYYTTHRIIKVLNKDGLDAADINFATIGKLKDIQAATYNNVNGKWIATTFNPENIFEENIIKKENVVEYKIPMPNVSVGSIIEVVVKITYPRTPLIRDWYFQDDDYPVLSSTYKINHPKHFTFGVEENKIYPIQRTFLSHEFATTYAVKNIPSVNTEESYSPSPFFHSSNIRFQLNGFSVPGALLPNKIKHRATYNGLNEYLIKPENFEKHLKKNKKEIIKRLEINLEEKDEKSNAIYIFKTIQEKIKWDGFYSFFPRKSMVQVIKDGIANSSEINMLLIASLNAADITAYPVISSTRDNGKLHPETPFEENLNYLLCAAKINDELILLDATRKHIPFGMIPHELLNGDGYMIDEKENGFINLQKNALHQKTYVVNLKIDKEKIIGDLTSKLNDYASFSYYQIKGKDVDKMKDNFEKNISGEWELDSFNIKEFDLGDPIIIKGSVSKEIDPDELIYIEPALFPIFNGNPFKDTERTTPVDIPYQIKYRLLYNLEIPEGYTIEERPLSNKVSLVHDGGSFTYIVEEKNNKISINIAFTLSKKYFELNEYNGLQKFYKKVHEQMENVIVLKKV